MNKRLLVLTILIFSLLFPTKTVVAERDEQIKPAPKLELVEARKLDPKAQVLAAYLETHNSPLQFYAQDFIDAAETYNLDWRLVAAISGVESTFGKVIPGGYNGWGWGIYGTQRLYFKSWTEGIYTVSRGLRENYVNKGLTEPYSMNRAYAASPNWGGKVTFFMWEIEKFAQNYKQPQTLSQVITPSSRIAAISGQLVFK